MKIRQSHHDATQLAKVNGSVRRIVLALRESLPDETSRFSDQELDGVCRVAIVNGMKYGLVSEKSVYVYSACMVLFGADFDKDDKLPWAVDVLPDEQIDEVSKRNIVEIHVLKDTGRDI